MATVAINLPPLHKGRSGSGGQVEIDQCQARFVVVACGRRWGKTMYGVYKCVKSVVDKGGIYWWIGPHYQEASRGWVMLKRLCGQIPGVEIREADRCIRFPGIANEIWIKSGDDPNSLRGEGLDGAVLDECAFSKEAVWFEAIRPALADKKGWAVFISTPRGKNWFYRLWRRGEAGGAWASFKRPTIDNPFIDPREIEAARQEMSDEQFAQEFEADFGASQFLVFPEFDRDVHSWRGPLPPFTSYHAGLDFGGDSVGNHKSAGVVAGRTKKDELIFFDEFESSGPTVGERQLEWMMEELAKVQMMYKPSINNARTIRFRADKTQMWGISLVRRSGFSITQSKGGKDSIEGGIELIHRRLKRRPELSNKPTLYVTTNLKYIPAALERYQYADPPDDEQVAIKRQPLKVNDDTMDAFRYCVEDCDFAAYGQPEKFFGKVLGRIR